MAGRAGAIRAACKLGGIPFENSFVDASNWAKAKTGMPFGQVGLAAEFQRELRFATI